MVEIRARLLKVVAPAILAAALASGCVSSPPPPPPPAPPPAEQISEADLEAIARLLRAEDRREFDEALLSEAVAAPSAQVRRRGALAIGRLRRPEGSALLVGLLNDSDSSVAATAAFSLGQLGDSSAVAILEPLLVEAAVERPSVASEAAYALGKLGSASASRALRAFLSSPGQNSSGPVGSALLAVWRFPLSGDLAPIVRWTEAADPGLRWRAAYALSRRAAPEATPALLRLVGDDDSRVRAFAVRGLTASLADASGVGSSATLPVLFAALEDSVYAVRIDAIRTLGSYAEPPVVARLISLLSGPESHAALAAIESLGSLGTAAAEAAPALRSLALADSAHVALRQEAVVALSRVSPSASLPVARELATAREWRLRAAAARTLAYAGGPDDADLGHLLRGKDGRVAAAGLDALIEAAGDSVDPLRRHLLEALGSADVRVRASALAGLARLSDPSILPVLMDAYERALVDSMNDAALAAVDAIGAVGDRAGTVGRAFFARFQRSPDYLVRLRVRERFGASADSAWGDPLPFAPDRSLADYRSLVRRWLAPTADGDRDPEVEIETEAGTIRLRLFGSDAPLTAESFLSLVESGFFDAQEWPRVVPNFVVQGGDPRGDTHGGPGYALRDEINRHRYRTGSLGMALSGPDSGGSQFFATHSPQPHLDGIYPLFGEITDGRAVVEAILPGDRIRTIRLVQ